MSAPQEHERLTRLVRDLEAQKTYLQAENIRLRTELAQTQRAAQGLATYGPGSQR